MDQVNVIRSLLSIITYIDDTINEVVINSIGFYISALVKEDYE